MRDSVPKNPAPCVEGEVQPEKTDDDCVITEQEMESALEEVFGDVGAWIVKTLRQNQPDAEITRGSVKALSSLLDNITTAVLDEAKRISEGEPEEQEGEAAAAASSSGAKQPPLTSLDIHKALKRLLPGEPGEPLRPYLPAVTKKAWHMDKQSFKGVKRQKGSAGNKANKHKAPSAAASEEEPPPALDENDVPL